MATEHRFRHYLALEPRGELAVAYSAHARAPTALHRRNIHRHAERNLNEGLRQLHSAGAITSSIVGHPSLDWRLVLDGQRSRPMPLGEHIWSVEFVCHGTHDVALGRLHAVRQGLSGILADCVTVTAAADMPVFTADYWSPAEAAAPLFGDRNAARKLMGLIDLRQPMGPEQVNVVVVDQGVDEQLVGRLGGTFGGGWEYSPAVESGAMKPPGQTKGGHGAMMVRNILDAAPGATIFDCNLLPPRISNIRMFLSHAHAAYGRMVTDIENLRERDTRWGGPWIFVNAWAIFDRKSEHPLGDYTDNARHPFNTLIARTVDAGYDTVFCAGNCGQFCPVMRCGANDRGPEHSIYGANSHPRVLTAGAVRVDGLWLGYSSQGPGQPNLETYKPDLCAPSQFAETRDAFTGNTGTSAASALTAGAVAVLRSWYGTAPTPDELKGFLVKSARKTEGVHWNGRMGYGILNLAAALDEARRHQRVPQPG
jgi:hypothetical protein